MAEQIPMPSDAGDIKAKLDEGWCVGYPPENYKGSVADWCVGMATRGYPENYEDLCYIMVPDQVWWEVLEECEGGPPAGECSIYCEDDKHHETCREKEPSA